MKIKKIWTFPVPSTQIYNGVKMLYPGANVVLLFDYYNEINGEEKIYNSGIKFNMVKGFKHFSEGFGYIDGAYDELIEIENSEWVKELSKINPYWEKNYNYRLRHFAIYLDSNGLYEFVANDCKIIEPKIGKLGDIYDELCEIK